MAQPTRQGLYDPRCEHDACGVGFLVHLKGERSHRLVHDGITALNHLNHRGACGCEETTGDGAGVLIGVPHEFLVAQAKRCGFALPERGAYGVGCLFLPPEAGAAAEGKRLFESIVADEGQRLLGWRPVPTNAEPLGPTARASEPAMEHVFIGWGAGVDDPEAFERKLYVIRRRFEKAILDSGIAGAQRFYFPSLSAHTLVYKGMLTAWQLDDYFPDLCDESLTSALCMVHSRFSTNTFPNWKLAHPFRVLAHNGEINTLRGNINWMNARETLLESSAFAPGDLEKVLPAIADEGQSDSATLDNVLELLILSGYSVPHAVMMLIPEAWEHHDEMSREKREFYAYHSCLMEPWDGPASVTVTDGRTIGATLDRNGLRPSRYWVTSDDLVIMASEVGVLDVPPEKVVQKGRLEPGRMFFVDMAQGRIVGDDELKHELATARPYGVWLREFGSNIDEVEAQPAPAPWGEEDLLVCQQMHGYTVEDQKYILGPMAERGLWNIGSMGDDTPLAVLSERPKPLYNYFKQSFAQVTNPPLDCIREEMVTSVHTALGPRANLLEPGPEAAHQIQLHGPVLTDGDMARLKSLRDWRGFSTAVLPMTFEAKAGAAGLERALDELFAAAEQAVADGANILVISDRGADAERAPIPSLLATSGLHNHLVRRHLRAHVGLVVECGDAREVHHFCCLLGYGASAINPYLAFESLRDMHRQGLLNEGLSAEQAERNYIKALAKGIVKVMAKMGISTIQSYRGAQIFAAVGLHERFIDRYFPGTPSQISGIGLAQVAEETLRHHRFAYPERPVGPRHLDWGGDYQWRREGEYHLFNPETVFRLQHASRSGRYDIFRSYSARVNEQNRRLCTLRGLFDLRVGDREPVPLEEVEPATEIVKRFCTGAMSYGSISAEAHETLAIAMNRIGGWSNTGEGGEDPARFTPDDNGDLRRSRIKQVASGRFGVTSHYLVNADEIQIKMAQGAKPGEGGELPGFKVYPWIAKVRGTTPGVGLISPPPHHDIYSIEDLAQLIFDLKNSNPRARICVKLVAGHGVGTIAAGVAKAHSDVVLISGHDGGTGASPITSIKHAGLPWEIGLSETQQTLVLNKLRDRIRVQVDGQMKTGRDVVIGALLGAEEFGFATAPLVVMGCIMMRVCHLDTCPVGVATQNPELRERFTGKAEHVVNFMMFVAEEVRELMAQLGFRTMDEMIGRSDLLDMRRALDHYKARGLDYSRLLHRPDVGPEVAVRKVTEQDHGIEDTLDWRLVAEHSATLAKGEPLTLDLPITNLDRAVGTLLGSEITRHHGGRGLPDDTVRLRFAGSAGQSFGAFVPHGVSLTLEGDANDYCGKGLSGGRIVVFPPRNAPFKADEQILIGNVALYGATSGRAYFGGRAGERFAVRNSGVYAVVEGVGDHCCEYMTGGMVVVLGRTGRNFGAGMSGGIAYVLDEAGDFSVRCNQEMVELEKVTAADDRKALRELVGEHRELTGSARAEWLLQNWEQVAGRFVKVIPTEYRRALEAQERAALEPQAEMATAD